MPKLEQYVAPTRELRPDNAGYQAFETEGRRIGGIYREMGTDLLATARANAQNLTNKAQWPFTLFALKQKFTPKSAGGGVGFKVAGGVGSGIPNEIMPNLDAANRADQALENFPNPLAKSLSPEGARDTSLATQAAALTVQMRGLIGSGDTTGGFGGPRSPGPNADAQASANAWGNSISGVPTGTGVGAPGGDYGGNGAGDAGGGGDTGGAVSAPVTDMGGGAFGGM